MAYRVIDREGGGGRLTVGDGAKIDDSADIDITADVLIGTGAAISADVLILTHDHDPDDITRKHASPLTIGDGAWIGARAIVLASCSSIGAGAVIGAGSVVTRDVPAHTLVAGNPARVVRPLRG